MITKEVMHVLITGGAGYIGSLTALMAAKKGYQVSVLDKEEVRNAHFAENNIRIFQGNILDESFLDQVFAVGKVDAVIHFAAFALVGESFEKVREYYENNVVGSLRFFSKAVEHGVKKLQFSSSCAVYGHPQEKLLHELHTTQPINPYGSTKLVTERMLSDFQLSMGVNTVAIRYFNVAGANKEFQVGEDHQPETHLIPNIFRSLLSKKAIKIFGNDYETSDGTCVRDYIHVQDVAQAHLTILENMIKSTSMDSVYNLGTGYGHSNKELVEKIAALIGVSPMIEYVEKRQGDPSILIADASKIAQDIGYTPQHSSIDEIIKTHWEWLQTKKEL